MLVLKNKSKSYIEMEKLKYFKDLMNDANNMKKLVEARIYKHNQKNWIQSAKK